MATSARVICRSDQLVEGGKGVRFNLSAQTTGFVVRYDGVVRGFVNACPHAHTELDWQEGEFFDASGLYLICATHGAIFQPDDGLCVGGPCAGAHLGVLAVAEQDGSIVLNEDA